jgi:K+-transporting ATPase KdpF subunit
MATTTICILIVTFIVLVYLVITLLRPEKF